MNVLNDTLFDSGMTLCLVLSARYANPINRPTGNRKENTSLNYKGHSKRLVAATVLLQAIWPEHKELLQIKKEDNLNILFRVPAGIGTSFPYKEINECIFNDFGRVRIDRPSADDLIALKNHNNQKAITAKPIVKSSAIHHDQHDQLSFSHPSTPSSYHHVTSNRIQQNTILHVSNFDRNFFKTALQVANVMSVYGPIEELVYLTNQGKAFVRFAFLPHATHAMNDINRFEGPNLKFLRANYSKRTKLSTTFKTNHHISRNYNDVLDHKLMKQRDYHYTHSISQTVCVSCDGWGDPSRRRLLSQWEWTILDILKKKVTEQVVLGCLGEKGITFYFDNVKSAVKGVAELHGARFGQVTCVASFTANIE